MMKFDFSNSQSTMSYKYDQFQQGQFSSLKMRKYLESIRQDQKNGQRASFACPNLLTTVNDLLSSDCIPKDEK